MASNPYVNKVTLANGTTLVDLTSDTLQNTQQLMSGVVAHDRTGATITGTWSLAKDVYPVGSLWATYDGTKLPGTELGFGTWIQVSPINPTWRRLKQSTTYAEMAIDSPVIYVWRRTA